MNVLSPPLTAATTIRQARMFDADAISDLYVRTYTPRGHGDARDHYPFPQIMDPQGVAGLIDGGKVLWMVAESSRGDIVGSAAAMRNIGTTDDCIAEVFGVAVDGGGRYRGIGSSLVKRLVEELGKSAKFILCEARTAEAGGWKVARNAGFIPMGFEPYAHAMPVGFESMVLTGFARSSNPRPLLESPEATAPVRRLANAVLGDRSGDANSPLGYELKDKPLMRGAANVDVQIYQSDVVGRTWFEAPSDLFDRSSGIVSLNPLRGVNGSDRFLHFYYVAVRAGETVGAARVSYDKTDCRARILGLRTQNEGIRMALLRGVVEDLQRRADKGLLVILTCVNVAAAAAQAELSSLGFFPTAYLPGLVHSSTDRADVVQFTQLFGHSLATSAQAVTAFDWLAARRVIEHVLQNGTDDRA